MPARRQPLIGKPAEHPDRRIRSPRLLALPRRLGTAGRAGPDRRLCRDPADLAPRNRRRHAANDRAATVDPAAAGQSGDGQGHRRYYLPPCWHFSPVPCPAGRACCWSPASCCSAAKLSTRDNPGAWSTGICWCCFAGLFIVTGALSDTPGLPARMLDFRTGPGIAPGSLPAVSLLGSNTVGNVPLVMLVLAAPAAGRRDPALRIGHPVDAGRQPADRRQHRQQSSSSSRPAVRAWTITLGEHARSGIPPHPGPASPSPPSG